MYELMVIAKESEADTLAANVEKFIKDASGENISVDRMGKKPLAYPIAKQTEAEYLLFAFEAPGDSVSKVVSKLRLEQGIALRYLIIKSKAKSAHREVFQKSKSEAKTMETKKDDSVKSKLADGIDVGKKDDKITASLKSKIISSKGKKVTKTKDRQK